MGLLWFLHRRMSWGLGAGGLVLEGLWSDAKENTGASGRAQGLRAGEKADPKARSQPLCPRASTFGELLLVLNDLESQEICREHTEMLYALHLLPVLISYTVMLHSLYLTAQY